MKQKSIENRVRVVVMIDPEIARLSKALAAKNGLPLWLVIERSLRATLAGVNPPETKKGAKS